jgi:hypothetical protein
MSDSHGQDQSYAIDETFPDEHDDDEMFPDEHDDPEAIEEIIDPEETEGQKDRKKMFGMFGGLGSSFAMPMIFGMVMGGAMSSVKKMMGGQDTVIEEDDVQQVAQQAGQAAQQAAQETMNQSTQWSSQASMASQESSRNLMVAMGQESSRNLGGGFMMQGGGAV